MTGDRGRSRLDDGDEAGAQTVEMAVREVRVGEATHEGFAPVVVSTNRGNIEMRYYPADGPARDGDGDGPPKGAIFVGGAGGGWDTPVRGRLYPGLCQRLPADGIACLRVRYRHPADLPESTLDVLAGVAFLQSVGVRHVALAGHSFGGAVVIQAAATSDAVRTCIPLSTQGYGAEPAAELGPRCSILLGHGTADEVLHHRCSEYVYDIAGQPKKLVLKKGARHGLDEWADELPDLLRDWIRIELARAAGAVRVSR